VSDPLAPAERASSAVPPRASRRDLRLDLLRGLCVLLMIFGHLGWRQLETHFRFAAVTVAECFFFLSGATLAVVARRRQEPEVASAFDRRLVRRGLWLYAANLCGVGIARLLEGSRAFPGNYYDRYWRDAPELERWLSLDQPSVLNVLPRYAVFLVVAPLVIAAARRGAWLWMAAASTLLWFANWSTHGALRLPLFESVRAPYPVASWQLLFFGGLFAGWLLHAGDAGASLRLPARRTLEAVAGIGLVLAMLGALPATAAELNRDWWTSRALFGPLRALNFVALAIVAWALASRWTPAIAARAGRWLLPFGQYALPAFLLHIPFVWALLAIPAIDSRADLRKLAAVAVIAMILPLLRWPPVQRWLRP
jgi:peptidoglycan/LPS O-acetylase OafA/YrhL